MRPFTMADFDWNFDPAASGPRRRAFQGSHELVAYEDGRWFLHDKGMQVAGGLVSTLDLARQAAVCIYNLRCRS